MHCGCKIRGIKKQNYDGGYHIVPLDRTSIWVVLLHSQPMLRYSRAGEGLKMRSSKLKGIMVVLLVTLEEVAQEETNNIYIPGIYVRSEVSWWCCC